MPDARYRKCRDCGRDREDAGLLSWTRLCIDCAKRRMSDNNDDIHRHAGPGHDRWKRALVASVLDPQVVAALEKTGHL